MNAYIHIYEYKYAYLDKKTHHNTRIIIRIIIRVYAYHNMRVIICVLQYVLKYAYYNTRVIICIL